MLNPIPQTVAYLGLTISILALAVHSFLIVFLIRRGNQPRRGFYLTKELTALGFFLVWCLFLALAAAGLTFDPLTTQLLRWALLLYTVVCLVLALLEHEWTLLLPGFFVLLTVPFFETVFGSVFGYVLLAMLIGAFSDGLVRLIQLLRSLPNQMRLSSIQDAIDSLDDGLLFAEQNGAILLANRIMDDLSISLCHRELNDANEFWSALESVQPTEFLSKVSSDGSYLFRFNGGNTWTLHRETFRLHDRECIQIVALNVTESDHIQRQTIAKKAELARANQQLPQVEATMARLDVEEGRVERGRKTFDSITEKMTALNRFFTEHYALPADAFDYKKLAMLTAGLMEDLEHTPTLTPRQRLELTGSALHLIGVPLTIEGALPDTPAAADAISRMIREACLNAILHGNATAITVRMEWTEEYYLCSTMSNGTPLTDALTPGDGITSIRRTLFPLGGTLEITKEPKFILTAKIPAKNAKIVDETIRFTPLTQGKPQE